MISIIVPTLNEERVIGETLAKIRARLTTHPYELIISDDRSTDRTAEIARQSADVVVERKPDEPKSIAAGRNRGARAARGEFLMFIDADVEIPDINVFITTALSSFEQDPSLVALTGAIRVQPDKETLSDRIVFGVLNISHRVMNNILGVGVGPGEFQMIRRNVFERLHGYNEQLIASEDYEMFYRLSRTGKTRMEPRLLVLHSGRRAHAIGWPRLLWQWFTNAWSVRFFKRAASKEWEVVR